MNISCLIFMSKTSVPSHMKYIDRKYIVLYRGGIFYIIQNFSYILPVYPKIRHSNLE